mgnify:CR=1 FL=1
MIEMRERIGVINSLIVWPVPALFVREMCYLQLRHICEVLAIGCLAAQGDFKTLKAFRKEYRPPQIFNALRSLYPNFFPQPAKRTWVAGRHHLQGLNYSAAYDEQRISSLWSGAGDKLHRLSVDKYLKKSFGPEDSDLSDIKAHVEGVTHLLSGHVIPLNQNGEEKTLFHVEIEATPGPIHAHFLNFDSTHSTVEIESFKAELMQ